MAIFSYLLVFVCGVIAGMCLAGLLESARHNIDETQPTRPMGRRPTTEDSRRKWHSESSGWLGRPTTPEDFRPSMHNEAE